MGLEMPREYKYYRSSFTGKDPDKLTVHFEDIEWSVLIEFLRNSKRLDLNDSFQEVGSAGIRLSYAEKEGLFFSTDIHSEENILSLLHRLRPFVAKTGATNFYRVSSILGLRIEDPNLRQLLRALSGYFLGQRVTSLGHLTSDDVCLVAEKTVDKLLDLNEEDGHIDQQRQLEFFHNMHPSKTSRAIFAKILADKKLAVQAVAHIISVLAGEQQGFSITLA
ncbi:MAG: hypothetical protein ACYS80_27525 [Planctomycetota bacterium]|jgi:hypothetical protein